MKRDAWRITSIILLAIASVGCTVQSAEKVPTPVKVKSVEMSAADGGGARYSASILPRVQVELAFKVGGYVEALHKVKGVDGRLRDVQEGDLIAKGTVLARLRQSDYAVKVTQAESHSSDARAGADTGKAQLAEAQSSLESSQSQLTEAEAAYEKARSDFDRAATLFASQSLTKPEYDSAKTQLDMAEAKLKVAKAQIGVVKARINVAKAQIVSYDARVKGAQAQVVEAAIPLHDTLLRAPVNCVVLQKKIEFGALISPGTPGFVIADTTSVKALFGVPDLMIKNLKLGDPLLLTTESAPGADFQGQITAIAPAADPKSRVFDIEVTIPNEQDVLKVGMIAALTVAGATPAAALPVVPLNAIVKASNESQLYAVFVFEEHGGGSIARQRNIKLGETFGNTVAVIEGLKAGERVITTGANLIQDGDRVQLIP
jgi:RND family efflux transporter MFP subunit